MDAVLKHYVQKTPTVRELFNGLLAIMLVTAFVLFLGYIVVNEIKYAFFDKIPFLQTTSAYLIVLAGIIFCFRGLYFILKKLRAKDKSIQIGGENFVMIVMAFSLIATPLIVRPALHSYLKSQGYERCWGVGTGLTDRLSPSWAKPSVGCEVWELDDKERDALIEKANP